MIIKKTPYRIIISGGGTGGHVFPAIAIGKALKELAPGTEFLFVGAEGKMEMNRVPEAGFKIVGLNISGIQRNLSPKNLSFPFKVLSSLLKANKIIKTFEPHVAVGVGGYASGPILYLAARKNIPTLIQEQNSYAGLTNKLLSKKVNLICVAHPGMENYFPKEKIRFTGNPVRDDIKESTGKRDEGLQFFGLAANKKTIFVLGGSMGARTLNESIFLHLQKLIDAEIQLIWPTGTLYYDEFKERTRDLPMRSIRIFPFLKEISHAYAAADLVISRAGALAVSELCIVKKPVIFVPSPNVAEDHQTKNAQSLVDIDAALLVPDRRAQKELVNEALKLIYNTDRCQQLRRNIARLARPNAATDIANEILKLAQ